MAAAIERAEICSENIATRTIIGPLHRVKTNSLPSFLCLTHARTNTYNRDVTTSFLPPFHPPLLSLSLSHTHKHIHTTNFCPVRSAFFIVLYVSCASLTPSGKEMTFGWETWTRTSEGRAIEKSDKKESHCGGLRTKYTSSSDWLRTEHGTPTSQEVEREGRGEGDGEGERSEKIRV